MLSLVIGHRERVNDSDRRQFYGLCGSDLRQVLRHVQKPHQLW